MSQKELEEEKRNEEEKRKQTIAEYGDPGEGYEWASDVDNPRPNVSADCL